VHRVFKKLADGSFAVYVYAHKGGPRIQAAYGATREAAGAALSARARPTPHTVKEAVSAYLASPEYGALSPSTRRAYGKYIGMFAGEFGENPLGAFRAYQVRNDLTDWRDQFIATPRTADYIMRSVSAFFGWARSRGLTDAEPVRGIRGVHKANRSDVIWTRKDFHVIRPHCSKALYVTLRFAAETGLRQGDLIALTWSQIDADTIQLRTRKTGGVAIVPLTRVAKVILKGIDTKEGIVLRGASGRPWTADGLSTVYQRAKTTAGLKLRWHDLRGTAATRFRSMGFTNEEVATAMGWSVAAVESLMVRYVKSGDTMRAAIKRVNRR